MFGQTRVFYSMSKDGLLPPVLGKVHPKFKTPWINTIIVGLVVSLAAAVFDINYLGDMTSVGTLVAFGLVCFSVIWLRAKRPDLVLCDIHLPGICAVELASRLRGDAALHRVPLVALTAFAMASDRERFMASGFDGCLTKPITPETFVAQVEAYLPAQLRGGAPVRSSRSFLELAQGS